MTFGLVDTFFISMLGTLPLAAVGFSMPVVFVVMNFTMGLSIGLSVILAKVLGANQHEKAARLTTDNLVLALILVVVVSLLGLATISPLFSLLGAGEDVMPYVREYMTPWYIGVAFLVIPMVGNGAIRATGDMKTPSMIMIVAGIVNGILDPLLIFGIGPFPEMGISGAAWATVISWMVTFIGALWILRKRNKLITFQKPSMAEIFSSWKPVLYIGIPAGITNLLIPVATGVMTAIIARHGPEAVAAFGVGSRIEAIAMVTIMAMGASLTTFIGQNIGAQQLGRIKDAITISLKFTLWFQTLISVLLILASSLIARLFSDDVVVIAIIVLFLSTLSFSYPAQAILMLTGSMFNSLQKPIDAMILSIIRLFVFYIPMAWLGSRWFGLTGFFIGAVIGSIIASGIAYFWLRRRLKEFNIV